MNEDSSSRISEKSNIVKEVSVKDVATETIPPQPLEDVNTTARRNKENDPNINHFFHRDHEILVAAEREEEERIRSLILKKDVQHKDPYGRNALHFAAVTGNLEIIKMLIEAGLSPNSKDSFGMTPLSLSLFRRPSIEIAKYLFDHGAVLMSRKDPVDNGLFLQFIMMCLPTHEEQLIIRLLVEKGADVNDPNVPGARSALHFAAMNNNVPLIDLLLELGADINARNHRNETPRDVAKTFKCKKAMNYFEQNCYEEYIPVSEKKSQISQSRKNRSIEN